MARALFTLGWAYEKELNDNEKAYQAYKSLVELFPKTKYALKVRKKVSYYEQSKKKKKEGPKVASATADSKSKAAPPATDRESRVPTVVPEEEALEEEVRPGRPKKFIEDEFDELEQLKRQYNRPKRPAQPGRGGKNKTKKDSSTVKKKPER